MATAGNQLARVLRKQSQFATRGVKATPTTTPTTRQKQLLSTLQQMKNNSRAKFTPATTPQPQTASTIQAQTLAQKMRGQGRAQAAAPSGPSTPEQKRAARMTTLLKTYGMKQNKKATA